MYSLYLILGFYSNMFTCFDVQKTYFVRNNLYMFTPFSKHIDSFPIFTVFLRLRISIFTAAYQ